MNFLGYEFFNDAALWPWYFLMAVWFFVIMMAAVILHEVGHALWFLIKKQKKIHIRRDGLRWLAGHETDYINLTDQEYWHVNLWGVLIGLIPIFLIGFFFMPVWLLSVPYCWGCRKDLATVIEGMKLEE